MFPIITSEKQKAFEENCKENNIAGNESECKVPSICGYYGRACRQMDDKADRFLCTGCALAEFGKKEYIFTISYNFDGSSVAKKCETMEEAIKMLHEYLVEEVNTIKKESGYDPSVLEWSEDDVVLVYAEDYTTKTEDRNYALEDCAYYRVFEVEN